MRMSVKQQLVEMLLQVSPLTKGHHLSNNIYLFFTLIVLQFVTMV